MTYPGSDEWLSVPPRAPALVAVPFPATWPGMNGHRAAIGQLGRDLAALLGPDGAAELAEELHPRRGRIECPVCREWFPVRPSGPRPTYCSGRCRTRASRAGGLAALLTARQDADNEASEAQLRQEIEDGVY